MGSPFEVAARAADAAQEVVFGEPILVLPRVRELHGTYGADVTRVSKTVTGVFTQAPESETLEGARRGGDPRGLTQFATAEARVWLSAAAVAALDWQPRRGDAVVPTDRGTRQWTVEKAVPTDLGDVTLILTEDVPA